MLENSIKIYLCVCTVYRHICHVHISRNAPAHKIFHKLCFSFRLGIAAVPREIENNAYVKFWGANKLHFRRN